MCYTCACKVSRGCNRALHGSGLKACFLCITLSVPSSAAQPNAKINWADGDSMSGQEFKQRKDMLLELDRQVMVALSKVHCKAAEWQAAAVESSGTCCE